MDVFQWPDTAVDSMRKNTVAATIEMEIDTQGAQVYSLELLVDENGTTTGEYIECNEDNNQTVWTERYCE